MSELLREIERFLKVAGIKATTFGRKSINDGKLVNRLRNGGQVLPSTEKRIRQFITSQKLK